MSTVLAQSNKRVPQTTRFWPAAFFVMRACIVLYLCGNDDDNDYDEPSTTRSHYIPQTHMSKHNNMTTKIKATAAQCQR